MRKGKTKAEFNWVLLFLLTTIGCSTNQNVKDQSDTPTAGHIKISVDETFYTVIDGELDTFHAYYKYAEVTPAYVPETQCFKDLMNDSARIIIATRTLNEEEKKYFESKKLFPRTTRIGFDAIAFITNNENADTIQNIDNLQSIFTGTIKNWNELEKQSECGDIKIIFDNKNSSTARYLKQNLLGGKDFPANCYALENNEQVIDYVTKNKGAIGVIGVNWISDLDDPQAQGFLKGIKVISIVAPEGSPGYGSAYRPYQAWIANKYYPFTREVYIISREARSGLGNGFASFVAGDKGQRIILKAGLIPASMPTRIQQFGTGN